MRAEREREGADRAKSSRPAAGRREPPPHPRAVATSAAEVLHLQHAVGNRAVARSLQRVSEDEAGQPDEPSTFLHRPPRHGLRALVPDSIAAGPVKRVLLKRLNKGPMFSDAELHDLARQDPKWLDAIGTGTYDEAVAYAAKGEHYDWLSLPPGKRLLVAAVKWRGPHDQGTDSPAFTLGRQLDLRGGGVPDEERATVEGQRDEQIREQFVDTFVPEFADQVTDRTALDRNARANMILSRVFLILQNGLKVYDPEAARHIDYTDGDVARALAHGGRVTIRIPALNGGSESATALPDWLGITENGVNEHEYEKNPDGSKGAKLEKRDFATHYMSIRGTEKFEERGGMLASLRNLIPRLDGTKNDLWGVALGAGGIGGRDFNGDVIMPDNSHGHMLLVFSPPGPDQDGALQVGLETIGPGGVSPVGHRHDWRSTEATANPESSFFGHKKEKIGGGKLKDNQRYVPLAELSPSAGIGWKQFLDAVKANWEDRLIAAENDPETRRELYRQLVGRREGRFTPQVAPPT
ncbi:hypothetical protein ABZ805_16425 [Saccharopolyspora sp. NPDC047091]|uniref:hypothetical protein n=1 Tax=Saccharopolyspora sp. NPDC047091 TaxID=3155924 RepID=UPI00340BF50B